MGQIQLLPEVHGDRLRQARNLFFDQGEFPEGLVDPLILRSWERCRRFGLGDSSPAPSGNAIDRLALKTEQHRNGHPRCLCRWRCPRKSLPTSRHRRWTRVYGCT